MSGKVIVFYSKDNNTRTGARLIAGQIGADMIELKEAQKGNFIQALRKKGSKLIGDPWSAIKTSSEVILMLPIWASNGVPAMNAFLERADFEGKSVSIITFQQFEDLRNSDKVHAYISSRVEANGGNVVYTKALLGGKMNHFAGESAIEYQVKTIDFLRLQN
jgi:flavodoxin